MKYLRGTSAVAVAAFGGLIMAGTVPANAATYVASVFASGLDNPRDIAFGPDGALYIAEGGTFNPGGPTTSSAEGGVLHYGNSGAVTRVAGGVQTRVVTGLPSVTDDTGAATGPQGIAFAGGTGYVTIGLGTNPAARTTDLGSAPGAANLAALYSFGLGGSASHVADLGNHETVHNPAGGLIDSNPYHLVAGPDGLLVTEAGGNGLLNVTVDGTISTVAVFPASGGIEAVPTGVSVGPDSAFYVGQLTGVPFLPGAADVFRVDPLDGTISTFQSGFTNITDIAFGADGSLYVLQFADAGIFAGGPGSIIHVAGDGSRDTIFGGLTAPTGLEIGADGAIYVTNFSPVPGIGEVLRIAAVPEPSSWALLIVGFGVIGVTCRRRRQAAKALNRQTPPSASRPGAGPRGA